MLQDTTLVITHQGSLEQEKVHKNGASKNVHAVIKNIPFTFELAASSPSFSFHKAPPIEAKLLYDCVGGEKPVDFVKASPMEYACKVSPKGDSVSVDMKLSVLSSQHEDMFFIVKFSFKGTNTTVLSDPIKVVSKPAQLEKIATVLNAEPSEPSTIPSRNLWLVSKQPNEINKQCSARFSRPLPSTNLLSPSQKATLLAPKLQTQPTTQPPLKKAKVEPEAEALSKSELFQKQLRALIQTYHDIPQDDRAETVRKAVKG